MPWAGQGYVDYDPALRLEGVIMNRVGGDAHTQWLREAVEESGVATRVLGGIPQARCAPLHLTVLWNCLGPCWWRVVCVRPVAL